MTGSPNEKPKVGATESRSRVRWTGALLGIVTVTAVLAVPVIHTSQEDPTVASCSDSGLHDLDAVLVIDSSAPMSSGDPNGLRRSATTAFVNGMSAQARAAIVDFDDQVQVVQGLTTDKGALIAAINTIDNLGGADLSGGLTSALAELSAGAIPGHDQVIVVMTDGRGEYDTQLTSAATAAGVKIFTIGLGSNVDSSLLTTIAESTGGTYSPATPFIGPPSAKADEPSGGPDSDGDGLNDCTEKQGSWDALGERHVTDARDPDTDSDGLTDGQEVTNDLNSFGAAAASGMLHLPLGIDDFRYVVSDPNAPDSDKDGAVDPLEFDVGTQALVGDSDGDGLGDFSEIDKYGTNPLRRDTDGDDRDDSWELENKSSGFDPNVYDEEMSKWDYAYDFVRGAGCPDGWGACEADSVAFLAGSIGGGFFGYKDVLDLIGNLTTLDFVGAGLAAAAVMPFAGDAASVVSKTVRFVERVPARKQIDGLAFLAKADRIPASARMDVLALVDGDSVKVIKGAGGTDDGILAFVRARIDFRVLSRAVGGASEVKSSPRLFSLESEAENYLRSMTPGALPVQKAFPPPAGPTRGLVGYRKPDIYSPSSKAAIELKNGYISLNDFVRKEVLKDAALLADPATPIDSVVWHFFPKDAGGVGPDDALRDLLTSSGIPYIIHLP